MQPARSEEEPPIMEQTRTVEDQKTTIQETGARPSVLAILCVFCASLGMLFFPAVVAIPLGIYALKYINESDGRLSGRQMAVTGLCVAITSLSLWLVIFSLSWLGIKILTTLTNLLGGAFKLVTAPFGN
ncbi:MAG: DUF4190 domain-containing protein [Verrucomicrobiota bacterium]|jgi:mannitol-specific phosphotransferase system IIBC component|nr:DUF4190 domain-containing protein [Verrucomicrobiota bacterium]